MADDVGTLAAALLEVESLWRGIERLEGEREVNIRVIASTSRPDTSLSGW